MNIRKVKIEDFDEILKLSLVLEDAEIIFDDNLKYHCYETREGKKRLKKRISNKNNIFYVIENIDNKIIGFIDGRVSDDEWWYKEKVAYLDHLCVDEDYRKQKIATKLLNKFEIEAKKKGAKYIRILAFTNNEPAVSLYKNNNYIEYSTYYNKEIK